jgi:hypothetical protein
MGAASAIMAAPRHSLIRGIIVDSCYTTLTDLFTALMDQVKIPSLLQPVATWWVKWEVQKKSGLDCDRVVPIEYAKRSNVPLLLGHSEEDELIPSRQARILLEAYLCKDKKLVPFFGGHNDVRPVEWHQECLKFVEAKLGKALDPMSLRTSGEQRVDHMGNLDELLRAVHDSL